MPAIQIVEIDESILDYFKMMLDFDNQGEDYREVTEEEFKNELTKAVNCGVATKEIRWVKSN